MYFLNFDVAYKSLATSIIKFNDNWKQDLDNLDEAFNEELEDIDDPEEICRIVLKYLDKIEVIITTLIEIVMCDVVDLIPGQTIKKGPKHARDEIKAARMSGYLEVIDKYIKQLYIRENTMSNKRTIVFHKPMFVKVLVEFQMGPNDSSRNAGSKILAHYAPPDLGFTNANEELQAIMGEPSDTNFITYDVEVVGPSLKNTIYFSPELVHQNFIEKYAKQYDANKAHAKANFKHWIKTNKCEHVARNIKKKNMDDIADSVMMCLAWLHKNRL